MGHLKEARAVLAKAFLEDDPRQTVLSTAMLSVAIGLFLARDFSVFDHALSYRFMRGLPENLWAVIFITVGLTKIVVCLSHEPLMRSRWRYLPFALNASTAGLWALVWAGIHVSNPDTLGTVLYFYLTLLPLWCAARRYRQAREAT